MGDFYFGMHCGSRVWFLSVCACVLWVKIGFVFLALVWCGFWGLRGGLWEIGREIVPFLSQKGWKCRNF